MDSTYGQEPAAKEAYTTKNDRAYTRYARINDGAVKLLPVWTRWLDHALPFIRGPRVLEVSFGTGYLLARYAHRFESYGVDYNRQLIRVARRNLAEAGSAIPLQQADVGALPYRNGSFDTVVNTMAFSGYPDGYQALAQLHRVLRSGGRLVLIDVNSPRDGNGLGRLLLGLWAALGDIIRDLDPLFRAFDFPYSEREIGGWGTIHLYLATKPLADAQARKQKP